MSEKLGPKTKRRYKGEIRVLFTALIRLTYVRFMNTPGELTEAPFVAGIKCGTQPTDSSVPADD